MQNDRNNVKEEKPTTAAKNEDSMSIFSEEEMRDTAKGFVLAWLSGKVDIQFANADEITTLQKLEGRKIDHQEARQQEIETKKWFNNLVAICCGAEATTPEEQRKAIHGLFKAILSYRAAHRIAGDFANYNLETRIAKLEDGIARINNLLEQLVEIHRDEMGI
jgi:hypothetical protein